MKEWKENFVVVDRETSLRFLLTSILALVVFHIVGVYVFSFAYSPVGRWFDLGEEKNIPTWFSSVQLLISSILSFTLYRCAREHHISRFYLLSTLTFLFLSIDESAEIHEGVTQISKAAGILSPLPDAHGMWIIVYPIIFSFAALLFRKPVLAFLSEKIGRIHFLTGVTVFLTGGIVFELLLYYLYHIDSTNEVAFAVQVIMEESLEMTGIAIVIGALLKKLTVMPAINFGIHFK